MKLKTSQIFVAEGVFQFTPRRSYTVVRSVHQIESRTNQRNGQTTQKREFHVDGPGRQQFHKTVTYGEGHVPTQEGFDQMTQVIEGCLDKIQRGLKQLEKEVSNPGSLILDELQETMTVLRSTTYCDLPGFSPPER